MKDIVKIIGETVKLEKVGKRYVGLCPFHKEETPSFSVNPDKGLYYCFGCHSGGDAVSFVMRMRDIDYVSAMRTIAANECGDADR